MATLLERNRDFYDPLWTGSRLVSPESFNTWPLIGSLAQSAESLLELAPGLCPRLPIDRTRFIDISAPAVAKLVARGADARVGLVANLPWQNATFDLVGAFDILEHVADDDLVLSELFRVTRPGAHLLLSVPIHAARWTRYDELVGHGRRYEPNEIVQKLLRHGWSIEESGVYGMQPSSTRLLDFVVWSFRHVPRIAVWWYAHVILPIGARFQQKLEMAPGLIDLEGLDEALLVCRRGV